MTESQHVGKRDPHRVMVEIFEVDVGPDARMKHFRQRREQTRALRQHIVWLVLENSVAATQQRAVEPKRRAGARNSRISETGKKHELCPEGNRGHIHGVKQQL